MKRDNGIMKNFIDFTGKNIVVTGASSGIGKSTAIMLANYNANVILIGRNVDTLEETNKDINNRGIIFKYDLTNIDDIETLIKNIVKKVGALDGLVHCAGIGGARPLNLLTKNSVDNVMSVNFYAFVELVRQFSKKNNFNKDSSVVVMSSIASIMGDKGKISYCASKAAVDAAVRCMAKELASKKIRVNSIRASWVRTNLYNDYLYKWQDNDIAADFIKRHYLGILDPEDVASMILFLLSNNSKKITGSSILIDSGSMA